MFTRPYGSESRSSASYPRRRKFQYDSLITMNYSPNKINRLYPESKTAVLCKLGITFSYIIYSCLLMTTYLALAVVARRESDCWMFVNSNKCSYAVFAPRNIIIFYCSVCLYTCKNEALNF